MSGQEKPCAVCRSPKDHRPVSECSECKDPKEHHAYQGGEEWDEGEALANGMNIFRVVRVNGDPADTHAGRTLEEALELAMPDEGDRLEHATVHARDAGAARLTEPTHGWHAMGNPTREEEGPVPFRLTIDIPDETVLNLLISAREGGSNYWCRFDECPYKEVFKVGQDRGEWRLNLPAHVSEYKYEVDELGRVLDRAAIQHGLDLLPTRAPKVLANILRDDCDAGDADVFLQLAILGEVVYG